MTVNYYDTERHEFINLKVEYLVFTDGGKVRVKIHETDERKIIDIDNIIKVYE